MGRSVSKLKVALSSAVFLLVALLVGVFSFLALPISGDVFANALPGSNISATNASGTPSGSSNGNYVATTATGGILTFKDAVASKTIGISANPVLDGYNLRNRGPENKNQGEALVYTNFFSEQQNANRINNDSGNYAVLQVFVAIGGELKEAIDNNWISSLSFDFYYGLGNLLTATTNSWGVDAENRSHTFFDISTTQVTNLSTRGDYNATGNHANSRGNLFAGTRNTQPTSSVVNVNARGETLGISNQAGANHWGFLSKTVDLSTQMTTVASNGGFWLKLFSNTRCYSSTTQSGRWTEVACVLEGITLNAGIKQPANPETPSMRTGTYGQKLSSIALPSGWAWANPNTELNIMGEVDYPAIYTPANLNTHYPITRNIRVSVGVGTPDIPAVSTFNAIYGQTLADLKFSDSRFSWYENANPLTTPVGDVKVIANVFRAEFTPIEPYYSSVIVNVNVLVGKAQLKPDMWTLPEIDKQYAGTTLGEIVLPTGWSFVDAAGTILSEIRTYQFAVVYTANNPNYYDLEPQMVEIVALKPIPSDLPSFADAIDLSNTEIFVFGTLTEIDLSAFAGEGYTWEWVEDMELDSDTEYTVKVRRVYDDEYEGIKDEEPFEIKITTTFGELNKTSGEGDLTAGLGTGVIVAGVACGVSAIAAIFLVTKGIIAKRKRKKYGC